MLRVSLARAAAARLGQCRARAMYPAPAPRLAARARCWRYVDCSLRGVCRGVPRGVPHGARAVARGCMGEIGPDGERWGPGSSLRGRRSVRRAMTKVDPEFSKTLNKNWFVRRERERSLWRWYTLMAC